ncbi:FecR family protein [Novosphingobium sp. JCM 18896]|uniref:FecR family protein n=1 Tax=Novosphingobium sp. JCM 18896 TaxID=2989731 RepID=UPI0022216368|nr:FecR domain-containing protein [Novosphingobium sp. JCM 18896]MCW1430807.1 FecR domain-containing protein [Novosphingobium sp. JCM 18896]
MPNGADPRATGAANIPTAGVPDALRDAAALWFVKVSDPAFVDWQGFTQWLEADPAHRDAYTEMVDADAVIGDALAQEARVTARHAPHSFPTWLRRAAAVLLLFGVPLGAWSVLDSRPEVETISTRPGERRTFVLADGSSIMLNGETRLRIDRNAPRSAKLLAGEALFEVRHDPEHPFVVDAGESRLVDVGTVFNVTLLGKRMDVAIADGAVIYRSSGRNVRLKAGDTLTVEADRPLVIKRTNPETVGGWRSGQLEYVDAPIGRIATDLSRTLGLRLEVAESARQRRFTGILILDGTADEALVAVAPVLDMSVRRSGDHWLMTSRDGI